MSFRSVLRNTKFRNFWLAQSISRVGDSIHEVALIWIVYELSNDPVLISITVLGSLLPMLLLSIPAGSMVDMWNRKYVMVFMDLVRGVSVLAIPFVGESPHLFPVVVGVAIVSGSAQAFVKPARNALIPNLVERRELDSANSLLQMTRSASRLLYGVGGGIVLLFGVYSAFYVDALSFLLSAVLLLTLPDAAGQQVRSELSSSSMMERIYEGVGFIRESRLLPSLLLLSLLTGFALGPIGVLLPTFSSGVLDEGSFGFGLLYSAIYFGILVGGIVVGSLDEALSERRGTVILAGTIAIGVTLVLAAIPSPHAPHPLFVSATMFVLCGFSITMVQIPLRSLAQSIVPDEMRGRVFGLWSTSAMIAPPISIVAAGPLTAVFGPAVVLAGEGVLIVCFAMLLSLTPVMKVRSNQTQEELARVNE